MGSTIEIKDIRVSGLYSKSRYTMDEDGFLYGDVRAANYEIDDGKKHDLGHLQGSCIIYKSTGERLYEVAKFNGARGEYETKRVMYFLEAGDYFEIYVHTQGRDPVENTGAFIGSVIYLRN